MLNKSALIAMSGGVDSSVAAFIMKERGFECTGCTMRLYDSDENRSASSGGTCCSLDDVEDARSVALRLQMPYFVFNFSEDFDQKIIRKFIRCYECGITPNPCIDCNRYMKFDKLFDRAKVLGCDCVVTGHYARIEKDESGKYILKKARDLSKDQSYVLYTMTQEQLAHTAFPLGELLKTETRAIAEREGFINAHKKDSQDICFVPDGDYASVIERHTGKSYPEGDFISPDGKVMGKHRGIIHYTVGQRRGLGIAAEEPLYVCSINAADNTVTIGGKASLMKRECDVTDVSFISGEMPASPIKCKVKIRYRHPEQPATVIPTGNDTVHIVFDEPQRAISPGQSAVFYDGDIVLGGGIL